jgi:glycosyltransferase involved in cell wall biosynthesis
MIPEGIAAIEGGEVGLSAGRARTVVLRGGPVYSIDENLTGLPFILNVGRLNRLKGQASLVRAWAGSQISKTYNLILIGGSLDRPGTEERAVINEIDSIMAEHPELGGRFAHVGGMPNQLVREFEARAPDPGQIHPDIYVCSSLKEEFGLAILEAMSAGFLCFGPINGGVSSYIEEGVCGFLIDTSTPEGIRSGLERVLLDGTYSPEGLREIAASGKALVSNGYTLDRTARELSSLYLDVIKSAGKSQ